MNEFYNSNSDFKEYVDKYCLSRRVSVEEALTHELVRQVYLMYTEKEAPDDKGKQ